MGRASSPWATGVLFLSFATIAAAFAAMGGLDIPRDPVLGFLRLYHLAWLGWALGAWMVWRTPPRGRAVLGAVLLGALVLRVVAWNVPVILETDHHRYMWDGWVTLHGFNPYEFAPSEVLDALDAAVASGGEAGEALRPPAVEARLAVLAATLRPPRGGGLDPGARRVLEHLEQVNHPAVPTCYPPVAELAFAACAWVSPGSVRLWKALVAGVDLVLCGLILLLLRQLGREPAWVLFYAWNPLPLKEYANTGHYDPLATALVLVGVLLLLRRRGVSGGVALGLGVAAKVYPLVLVPVLWRRLRAGGIAAALLVPALVWLPFLSIGPRAFDGLFEFAKGWEFNSSFFVVTHRLLDLSWVPRARATLLLEPSGPGQDFLLELDLGPFLYARLVMGAVLVLVLALLARWPRDDDASVITRALIATGALFLLAPVADPWYLAWVLPWACLAPSGGFLLLSLTVTNYYLYFLEWDYLWWSRPLEYLPALALLTRELARFRAVRPDFPWGGAGPDADD